MTANIIAIDPSLICTALVVNDKKFVYVADHICSNKKGELTKWFDRFSDIVTIRSFDLDKKKNIPYSRNEKDKLLKYILVTQAILDDILKNITPNIPSKVAIEGYSFSSKAGPLIDLVAFGTILRHTLYNKGFTDINVIAPTQLKNKAGSLAYPPTKKGKDIIYRNGDGVASGSFKKQDMIKCMLDDPTLVADEWVKRISEYYEELEGLKTTPKPLEDVNDAKLLYEWFMRNK